MRKLFDRKYLGLCLALLMMCAFMLPACGDNPTDKFLADYEKLVVKYEQAASQADGITQEEMADLQKESLAFASQSQDMMKDATNVDANQIESLQKLAQRLMEATQKIKIKAAE